MTSRPTGSHRWISYGILLGVVALAAGACSSVGQPLAPTDPTFSTSVRGPVVRDEYRLQVGDRLAVKYPYHGKMNQEVPIRPDGKISLETTGELLAAGVTTEELRSEIERLASDRLIDPVVVVIVTRLGERRVYVGGEVNKPGYVPVKEGMTPLQAVMAVGGFKDTAQKDSVLYVARTRAGGYEASRLDLDAVVRDGVPETVRIAGSDLVWVPATRIANANKFIEKYIRNMLPVEARAGATAAYPIQ